MKKVSKNQYYKNFDYRIEIKLTVQDHAIMKDFAQKGCYIYVIHDNIDNNRFFFISTKHYEKNTKINSEMFELKKIASQKESIHLRKNISTFGEAFFTLAESKSDINILISKFNTGKKGDQIFKKYKVHTKKIALDNPDWFLSIINSYSCISHRKKFDKESLVKNKYNDEIYNHYISSKFILKDRKFQKFNDHIICLDQGKTGKSSMISYGSEKADNISIAGLYGSSNGKSGKFEGGLVTLTEKAIILDEINELIEDKKTDKILSILNTILENGEYNYVKQFSAKIQASNQFIFLGNISNLFNFALFLEGAVGNTETIGRRIGLITYNNNLEGFEKGNLREPKPSKYLNAISLYMSEVLNKIIHEPKFLIKLYSHTKYKNLSTYYKSKLSQIERQSENDTIIQFIKSHKESIDRAFFRALKLHIYYNLDNFIKGDEFYNNHTLSKVLDITITILDTNIHNLKNIVDHVNNSEIVSKKDKINKENFEKLPMSYQNLIKFVNDNILLIGQKSVKYSELPRATKSDKLSRKINDYKNKGISQNIKSVCLDYGFRIENIKKEIHFGFVNKKLFESKTEGLFEDLGQIELEEDLI